MATMKNTAGVTTAKTPVKATKTTKLTKFKSAYTVNFPLIKHINPDDFEITIKVSRGKILADLYIRGEMVSQQAIPVKKTPNPPPMPHDELFEALEQLRFNFITQR